MWGHFILSNPNNISQMFYKLSTADIRYFQAIMFPVDVSVDVKAKKESHRILNEDSLPITEALILCGFQSFPADNRT